MTVTKLLRVQIRRVTAFNFRGIRQTEWWLPRQRLLCLVGAGDSTKTTLLDVISLVLNPRPNVTFSDADFYNCDVSQPIVLRVLIGDLTPALLDAETGFGMWLTGLSQTNELEHDPGQGSEACVMIQLTVGADLEPSWTVVRHDAYDDGLLLTGGRRRALGLFRVDERVDTHLRWGRGSALARLTEGSVDAVVTSVRRASREAVFGSVDDGLQATASRVATAAGTIGGGQFDALRPGWDPVAAAAPSALLLHHGTVPLTHCGLGTRRLISIAAQELATQDGNILLVDEIEHGLEPHRLLHVLHELRKRSEHRRGQVIITTHSPIAVQAMAATDISVVRNESGLTTVTPVPEDITEAQGALRAGPSAILARRVVVGEGATEAGILRALIRRWDDERIAADLPTHAALGVTFLNGGGSNAGIRAKVYHELGVTAALVVDNDEPAANKYVDEALAAGVTIARWQHGHSTETAIITPLTEMSEFREVVELAVNHKGRDAIAQHLRDELPNLPAREDPCRPATWTAAGYPVSTIRSAITAAAGGGSKKKSDKAWFKREDAGETLGEFIHQHWDRYQNCQLGRELTKVRQFIYGWEEPTDPSD